MIDYIRGIRNIFASQFNPSISSVYRVAGKLGVSLVLVLGAVFLAKNRRMPNISFPTQIIHGLINRVRALNPVAAKADLTMLPIELHDFKQLLQETQNLVGFKNFNPTHQNYEDELRNCTRDIIMGSTPTRENAVFIKSPIGKHVFVRQKRAKNEQLAFLISQWLSLNVVPATMALEGYEQSMKELLPQSVFNELRQGNNLKWERTFDGVVIQEGLFLHKNQIHVEKNPSMSFEEFGLDMDQVHRAVLFNLIVGRFDAGKQNTVIDSSKRIMEYDNEKLGYKEKDSWLFVTFADTIISKKVIEDILTKDVSIIKKVFKELSQFEFETTLELLIAENFEIIKRFLITNKTKEVKVCDLVHAITSN